MEVLGALLLRAGRFFEMAFFLSFFFFFRFRKGEGDVLSWCFFDCERTFGKIEHCLAFIREPRGRRLGIEMLGIGPRRLGVVAHPLCWSATSPFFSPLKGMSLSLGFVAVE